MVASQAVVLIGMPGAGKSTVGPALAQLMQWGFVDIDDVVAAEVGDVSAYIEVNGIEAFRDREAEAVHAVTETIRDGAAPSMVVAVGGGAVLAEANRNALHATGPVVWLRASLATLLEHVGDGAGRPLLAEGAEAALTRLMHERTSVYAEAANATVDVDGLDQYEAAGEVAKALVG